MLTGTFLNNPIDFGVTDVFSSISLSADCYAIPAALQNRQVIPSQKQENMKPVIRQVLIQIILIMNCLKNNRPI